MGIECLRSLFNHAIACQSLFRLQNIDFCNYRSCENVTSVFVARVIYVVFHIRRIFDKLAAMALAVDGFYADINSCCP